MECRDREQSPSTADEELLQVEPGDVLDHAGTGAEAQALGEYRRHAEQQRAGFGPSRGEWSEFVSGKEAQDKALGCDLHAVYTEHPIQDRTDTEMLEIADQAFEVLGPVEGRLAEGYDAIGRMVEPEAILEAIEQRVG